MKYITILTLFIFMKASSQIDSFPRDFSINDTLIMKIEYINCRYYRMDSTTINSSDGSTFLIKHFSPYMSRYYFEKVDYDKKYRFRTFCFLTRNKIKLNHKYNENEKSITSFKGLPWGLTLKREYDIRIDSTITTNNFYKFTEYYNKLKSLEDNKDKGYIAGAFIRYSVWIKRSKTYILLIDKKVLKQWWDDFPKFEEL